MRPFLSDRRGSVVTVFAFTVTILAVLTAIVMNQVSFYMAKRQLQSAVDMASLMIMNSGDITIANAKALIEEQLGEPVTDVKVVQGRYAANADVAASGRFTPNAAPFNAVQVDAQIPATKVMMAGMLGDNLKIDARARGAQDDGVDRGGLAVGAR